MTQRWILHGTHRTRLHGYEKDKSVPIDGTVNVSFWLTAMKPVRDAARAMMAQPLEGRRYLSAEEVDAHYGSDTDAVKTILNFANKYHLPVMSGGDNHRQVTLTVPMDKVEELFGTRLTTYTGPNGGSYRGREGCISLPKEDFSDDALRNIVGVFGLDNRSHARRFAACAENGVDDPSLRNPAQPSDGSRAVEPDASAATPVFFPPSTYGFPVNPGKDNPQPPPALTGAGQHIGVIGFGGTVPNEFFDGIGAPGQIVIATPQQITQGDANMFRLETLLDVDIVHRCAPDAKITVYAFDQTEQGWISGLHGILQEDPIPAILSISWGWPEHQLPGQPLWTQAAIDAVEDLLASLALRGVTVVVSSGDLGPLVHYPASSEFVLSCGGTLNPLGAETVWRNLQNASGGGVSAFIPKPAWQGAGIQCIGPANQPQPSQNRCLPDVCAWALYSSDKVPLSQGTSVAAPQWAALMALANESLNKSRLPIGGNLNSYLYDTNAGIQQTLNDITNGDNDLGGQLFYVARDTWDACTGWGSPRVMPFIQALIAASVRAPGARC